MDMNKPLHIAVSCGISRAAGGLFYAVSELCRAIHAAGDAVEVYGAGTTFEEEDRLQWQPVPVMPYAAFGPLVSSAELRRQLKAADADLVHQHGIWLDDQWAVLQWQKKSGRPVVISPHGMLDPWALQNSGWKKKLAGVLFANASLRRASCLHALCESELESIRAYGLKNPVAVIPNGVSLPDLGKPVEKGERKRLLFFGRLHPKKGIEQLIRAWAMEVPTIGNAWELVIAGWDDGGHSAGLEQLVDELGIAESVQFSGPAFGDDKDWLWRSADAYILPSFSEGLPMTVLEAWSYGLPVIKTRFCNIPDGFTAGAAIEIEPSDESVAAGLRKLAGLSAGELQQLGTAGRKLVEEKYTWPRIAENMRRVYRWCVSGGEVPDCVDIGVK